MTQITNAKILIMATNGFEQSELLVPRDKLREAGAEVHVTTLDGKEIKGWDETDWGETIPADAKIADLSSANYDAIVLPGGQINPDLLRVEDEAMTLLRAFYNAGKVVAAICHAPWLLIEAGIAKGRKMTSYHSIRTDVENAGAEWFNEAVIADKGLVTSRNPNDLDAFVAKIIEEIEEGTHLRAAA
ncbi:glutamine amidotransferase [Thioclava dalianensis]|uniref:Glutamine amidotransferase n=1 Tax=Thioclava dalianensis TaxID=1185766 RepID=A0A074T915_9RHOB|nr:type 1 glutamine amidotransferase domain-containing protein [Thioclava dalianensis]KEP68204.1 glutamine amidotransferase [Thioclava dalianensis]SFN87230.1 protease I [Thioclava dalianensis]